MTAFIVFGGFGLAALGVFGIREIEKIALRRAEQLVNERLRGFADRARSIPSDQASLAGTEVQEAEEKL